MRKCRGGKRSASGDVKSKNRRERRSKERLEDVSTHDICSPLTTTSRSRGNAGSQLRNKDDRGDWEEEVGSLQALVQGDFEDKTFRRTSSETYLPSKKTKK